GELPGGVLHPAAPRGNRAGQAAEVDDPPAAHRPAHLARRRGTEERRHGGGDRRRLAADVLRAGERRPLPGGAPRGLRPAGGAEGAGRTAETFEIALLVPFLPGDDVDACADFVRPFYALYIGGMGARGQNFHKDAAARLGYEAEADRIQELYLAGDKRGAAAA